MAFLRAQEKNRAASASPALFPRRTIVMNSTSLSPSRHFIPPNTTNRVPHHWTHDDAQPWFFSGAKHTHKTLLPQGLLPITPDYSPSKSLGTRAHPCFPQRAFPSSLFPPSRQLKNADGTAALVILALDLAQQVGCNGRVGPTPQTNHAFTKGTSWYFGSSNSSGRAFSGAVLIEL